MKKIILLSLLAMIQLFGCSARDRNEGLRYFSYNTSNGMVIRSGESYDVYRDADDSTLIHIDINHEKNNERLLVTDYRGIFDDLQKIIIEKKMYITSLYFRKMDSNAGTNYNCANPKLLEELKKVIDEKHLAAFPQTPLEKENTRKERWIVEAVFADGSKIEIVDYIPEYDAQDYDRDIERAVETVFDAELEAISKKSPDEIGEYSVTTYDEKGKPSRTINYDGEGCVLNGHDYNNPMLEF